MSDDADRQLRQTRQTVLEHLDSEPDDIKALFMASVLSEIDPDRDAKLLAHARRAAQQRKKLGRQWIGSAREAGLDALLFQLYQGMTRANWDQRIRAPFGRRVAEIVEALTGTPIGIDFLPEGLRTTGCTFAWHASGHLARAHMAGDDKSHGELLLDEKPGTARLTVQGYKGGLGFLISERYAAGQVHTTLNTPWHDGVESSEHVPWTTWVAQSLASLADAAKDAAARAKKKPAAKRKKSGKG